MRTWKTILREYAKRNMPEKQGTTPPQNSAEPYPLSTRMPHNNAADRRSELVKKPRRVDFKPLHIDMDENEAASWAMFYDFMLKHRAKQWDNWTMRCKFEEFVARISQPCETVARKRVEKIVYRDMAHQPYANK